MRCKHCGAENDDCCICCMSCGRPLGGDKPKSDSDGSSFGYAVIGFVIPLIGLILFLVYENSHPKRSKSAGKGALAGFMLYVIFFVYIALYTDIFSGLSDMMREDTSIYNRPDVKYEVNYATDDKTVSTNAGNATDSVTEAPAEATVSITFGKFTVTEDGYFADTSLEVTVKNNSSKRRTYFITIEAVDENGARLGTDMILADRLNPGQEVRLTAFKFVDRDKLDEFTNATFKVLEIDSYEN